MTDTTDGRYKKSEKRIQDALAKILMTKPLTEIGVSELSREANVSRATFYAHYENIGDVYDQLVQKVVENVQTFAERFTCNGLACTMEGSAAKAACERAACQSATETAGQEATNRPTFCEQIRSSGTLSGVTRDPRFFSAMMKLSEDTSSPIDYATQTGITKSMAEAVMLFQMSGCHAIATSRFAQRDDWQQTRELIDRFIEGGLNAIRKL